MKTHVIVICVGIFLLCWLVFGFRGLDAAVIGPACFLAGMSVKQKETEVAAFITSWGEKIKGWFK